MTTPLNTGRVRIGLLHTPKLPESISDDALKLQKALLNDSHVIGMHGAMNPLRWPPRQPTQPTLAERLWARLRGF